MAKRQWFHPLVADDVKSAVEYYDAISLELGNRFRAALRKRLSLITQQPELFARIQDERRVALVERFPYVVVYEIAEDRTLILGVHHAASDDAAWFER